MPVTSGLLPAALSQPAFPVPFRTLTTCAVNNSVANPTGSVGQAHLTYLSASCPQILQTLSSGRTLFKCVAGWPNSSKVKWQCSLFCFCSCTQVIFLFLTCVGTSVNTCPLVKI